MREKVFISVIDPEGRINKSEISVRNARTISLGRELGANTVMLPFRFVSSRHGEITFEGQKIYYRDLNSSNGTVVESAGLRGYLHQTSRRIELQDGALLRISGTSENDSITILFDTEQGEETWKRIPVGKAPLTIGRSSKNDVVLNSSNVSRQHTAVNISTHFQYPCKCSSEDSCINSLHDISVIDTKDQSGNYCCHRHLQPVTQAQID